MKRLVALHRRTPMKRINAERRAKLFARNFGKRSSAVRAMPCLVAGCRKESQAAHVRARGMGGARGDRRDLVPLCAHHHREAGERRTTARLAFQAFYLLDLEAEAARIAAELDAKGLP